MHPYPSPAVYGEKVFDQFVTRLYELSREFGSLVEADPDFELAVLPMSNILCFRYTGESTTGLPVDELNRNIRKRLLEEGRYYIVQTKLGRDHFLRTTIMNPFSTSEDFKGLLNEIKRIARAK